MGAHVARIHAAKEDKLIDVRKCVANEKSALKSASGLKNFTHCPLQQTPANENKNMADIHSAFGSPFSNSCALTFDVAPILSPTNFGDPTTKWMGIVTLQSLIGSLQEYRYEVFSTETETSHVRMFHQSSAAPTLPISGRSGNGAGFCQIEQPMRKVVTRGTVTNSNNMSFTFPIASPKLNYFVLVSPVYQQTPAVFPPTKPRTPLNHNDLRNIDSCDSREPSEMYYESSNSSPNTISPTSNSNVSPQEFGIFYTSKLIKKRNDAIRKIKESKTPDATVLMPVIPANESTAAPTERTERTRPMSTGIYLGEFFNLDAPIGSNNIFEVPEFSSPSAFADAMNEETKEIFRSSFSQEHGPIM